MENPATPPASGLPKVWEKLLAIVLVLLAGLLAFVLHHGAANLEALLKQMDLSMLPILTEQYLSLVRLGLYHPLLWACIFLTTTVFCFTWVGRSYRRMYWTLALVLVPQAFLFFFAFMGVFMVVVLAADRMAH